MMRAHKLSAVLLVVATLLVVWPRLAAAQAGKEVGTVAAVVGGGELQRAGSTAWELAEVGSPVHLGDHVRTRPTSRIKLVFQDDSVVDVGPATEMVIDSQTFDPNARLYKSVLKLLTGKIRAIVSEYYTAPRARYEVETPTAVAGVRGTEFLVQYDTTGEYTDVVGIENEVQVEGTLGVVGGGVRIGPHLATRVQKGRFPSAPRRIDETLFRQYLEGLEIMGTGGRDSLGTTHAAVKGTLLTPADNAAKAAALPAKEAAPAPAAAPAQPPAPLVVGAPDQPIGVPTSPDVTANTQPIDVFRTSPPGQAPVGSIHVGF